MISFFIKFIAIGVDLFAHLVIIKSTECYTFNGYKEYNESQILQMIGRAGRSRFNTFSTVIIMTKTTMKVCYKSIIICITYYTCIYYYIVHLHATLSINI